MDDKKAMEKKEKRIATYFTHTHTQINLENYTYISYDCDDVSYILYIIFWACVTKWVRMKLHKATVVLS